jgi:hypothetical protein
LPFLLVIGEPILNIYLVEVKASDNPASIVAENMQKNRKIVFQEELFASSEVKKVLGFRDLS